MIMKEIIISMIPFSIAVFSLVMSIRSFMEKGFLFNNAYIYATKTQREAMNKKPYYRQSAVVFLMICIMFLLIGIDILFLVGWMIYITIPIAVITVIYAIASSIAIEKK